MPTPTVPPRELAANKPASVVDIWVNSSKIVMAPMRELADITRRALLKANAHNVDLAKQYVDLSVRGIHLLGNVHEPQSFVTEQIAVVKESGAQVLASARRLAKLVSETQQEYQAWVEKATTATVETLGTPMPKIA